MAGERRKPRETSASGSLAKNPAKIPPKTGATSKDEKKAASDKKEHPTNSETIVDSLMENPHEQGLRRGSADIVTNSTPRKVDQRIPSKITSSRSPTKSLDANTRHPESAPKNDIKSRDPTQDEMAGPEKKNQRPVPVGSGPAPLNEPRSDGNRAGKDLEPSIARTPGGIRAKAEAKRRKKLPTTNTAGLGKTFKNLAIQNRFQQHRRSEPAPNPANLVFIDPKTGKNVKEKLHAPAATSANMEPQCQGKEPVEMSFANESIAGRETQLSAPRLEMGVTEPSKVPRVAESDTMQQSTAAALPSTTEPLMTEQQTQRPRVESSTTKRQIQPLPAKSPTTITVQPSEKAPTGPMRSRARSTTLTSQNQTDKLPSSTPAKQSAMADSRRSNPSDDVSNFSLLHTPTKHQSYELWRSSYIHIIGEIRLANLEGNDWEVLKVKLQCINDDHQVRRSLLALKSGPSTLYMDFTKSILASEYQNYFSMVGFPLNPLTLLTLVRMHHIILEEVPFALTLRPQLHYRTSPRHWQLVSVGLYSSVTI